MSHIFSFLAVWIIVLPTVVGAFLLRRLDKNSIIIFLVVIAGVIPQLLHFYQPKSIAETVSYNLYSPVEFLLYGLFLYPYLKSKRSKFFFWFSNIAYVIIVGYLLTINPLTGRFISEWVSCNNICYLVWLSLVLFDDMSSEDSVLIFRDSFVWYAVGIFGYAACTALIYAVWQIIEENEKTDLKYLYTIQNIFNVLTYVLFTMGFFKSSFKSRTTRELSLSTDI